MSFQKCPVCNGSGHVGFGFPTGNICVVFDGAGIINEQTGLPPHQEIVHTSTKEAKSDGE